MKKLNLLLIFVVFGAFAHAQIPKEAFELTNSLSTTLFEGKTDKAVDDMVKLNELYRPFFVERMHNSIGQHLNYKSLYYDEERGANSESFLRKLYDKKIPGINEFIVPRVDK